MIGLPTKPGSGGGCDAANLLEKHLGLAEGKEWCVCRFVFRSVFGFKDGEQTGPPTHGWPLQWEEMGRGLGWSEDAPVAFFTQEEAEGIAKEAKHKIAYDRAVHVSKIRWEVTLYSHYDGSEVQLYAGDNYFQATMALGVASLVVQRNERKSLQAKIKGRTDVLGKELPEGGVEKCLHCHLPMSEHTRIGMYTCYSKVPTQVYVKLNAKMQKEREDTLKLQADLYLGVMGGDLDLLSGGKFTVRLWDGMDGTWVDLETARVVVAERALEVWNSLTEGGTKRVSFKEIDYYKIFAADTEMKYSGGTELFRR
jgi:hypothetical protein